MKSIMLRRTKASYLQQPQRDVQLIEDPFTPEERDFYDALEKQSAAQFNRYVKQNTVMQNYTSILYVCPFLPSPAGSCD
jgi:hypothetical protein